MVQELQRRERAAGDEALRNVAKVLRRKMRATDVVARYGGDEFAIIHPAEDLAAAARSAQEACEAVEAYLFVQDGKPLRVTASFGVAELLGGEIAAETFLRADMALCACKETGGNCVHLHDGKALRRMDTARKPVLLSAQPQTPRQSASCRQEDDARTKPADAAGNGMGTEKEDEPVTVPDLPGRTHFCQQVRCRMAEWKRGGPGFSIALIEAHQCGPSEDNGDRRAREWPRGRPPGF